MQWGNRHIAAALGLSERRIAQIRNGDATQSVLRVVQAPTSQVIQAELPPEIQAMLEFTADAFEAFFNRFSGRKLQAHHKEWVESFIRNRRLLLNIAPRHGKSVIFATWIPIWLICRDRDVQIILVSKTHTEAARMTEEIAQQLTDNEDLVLTFGRFAPERRGDLTWQPSRGRFTVQGRDKSRAKAGQLTLTAKGAGQQVLGMEANFVFCDDIADEQTATSDIKREGQLSWFQGNLMSRVEGADELDKVSGHVVVLGQRVHPRDIYGELEEQHIERPVQGYEVGDPLWTLIRKPAILDWDTHEVAWPEHPPTSYEELMLTYASVGYVKFMTMYQQEPSAAGIGLTNPDWWDRCRDHDRGVGEAWETQDRFLPLVTVMSVDTSAVEWNAICIGDLVWNREQFGFVLRENFRFKGDTGELCRRMEAKIRQYKPTYTIMERWSYTQGFERLPEYQALRKLTIMLPHSTTSHTKQHEELGFSSLGADVEMGRIRIPAKDDAARAMTRNLEDELNGWPNAKTSDEGMALWFIKYNYRRLLPRENLTGFRGGGGKAFSYIDRYKESTRGR